MPISVPVPDKASGDVLTETNWDAHIRDNLNKLLDRGHRILTVAQFTALTGLEDGDEVYLEVDAANGVLWHLRYVQAESTFKWRYLGGSALHSEVADANATTSTSYVGLAVAGPSIALPRSGDYDVETGFQGTDGAGRMSYDIGGVGATDADGCRGRWPESPTRTQRKAGLGAVTLLAKYKFESESAQGGFTMRRMRVTPVRIRHDA